MVLKPYFVSYQTKPMHKLKYNLSDLRVHTRAVMADSYIDALFRVRPSKTVYHVQAMGISKFPKSREEKVRIIKIYPEWRERIHSMKYWKKR